MALAAADALATFDQTTGKLDLSPVLATVLLADTALMGLIGVGEPALKIEHRFNEDSLNDWFVTGNEGAEFSAADTTLDVTDASKLRVGAILKDIAAGKTELVQVTAISSNALTVTRGYGSTDGQTHAAAATWMIVSMPVQQGDETITDISKARTQVTQYVQLFKRTVKVADEMEAEASNGQHPGVASELKHQIMLRTLEMKREMNIALIHSVISAAPSDSVYGTMKGLREFLVASGGNHLTDLGTLTDKGVNKLYRQAWEDGGEPDALVGNADQITRFADFNAGKVRVAPSDRVAGVFVEKFLTEYGQEISLTLDRWFSKDEVALIQKDKVYACMLKGRGLIVEPLAKIGNAARWQLNATLTLCVKNATLAHAYASALALQA